MQASESELTQNIAMTENAEIKRKIKSGAEVILSKQSAHDGSRISNNEKTRAVNSPVKISKNSLAALGLITSPPTKHTRICKFETLFCRSHSIDDSDIKTLSKGKMPKPTIINDR